MIEYRQNHYRLFALVGLLLAGALACGTVPDDGDSGAAEEAFRLPDSAFGADLRFERQDDVVILRGSTSGSSRSTFDFMFLIRLPSTDFADLPDHFRGEVEFDPNGGALKVSSEQIQEPLLFLADRGQEAPKNPDDPAPRIQRVGSIAYYSGQVEHTDEALSELVRTFRAPSATISLGECPTGGEGAMSCRQSECGAALRCGAACGNRQWACCDCVKHGCVCLPFQQDTPPGKE